MSRVIPTDRGKQRAAVASPLGSENESETSSNPVVTTRPGSDSVPFSNQSGVGSSLTDQSSSTAPPLPNIPTVTSDTERDPHNEVERRRKLRISQNIKVLADTLGSPCHCGRSTRAEILEMVVQKIKELQQKNAELESTLKELPSPTTNEEDLSQRIVQLVEENLKLRAVLLAVNGGEKSTEVSQTSSNQCGEEIGHEEENENDVVTGKDDEDRNQVNETTAELLNEEAVVDEEREVEKESSIDGDNERKENSEGESEKTTKVSGSSGVEGGSSIGVDDKENAPERSETAERENWNDGQVGEERDLVQPVDKEIVNPSGGSLDQSWPMSSLLSSQSRSGVRDHQVTAHGLPILSPSYIAEQCSTSGACEQQFFGSTTSLLTPPTTICSDSPRLEPLNTSLSTSIPRHNLDAGIGTPQNLAHTTAIASSSVSMPLPPIAEVSRSHSRALRGQSIVQPWVGSGRHHPSSATVHESLRNRVRDIPAMPTVTVTQSHPLALQHETGLVSQMASNRSSSILQRSRNSSQDFQIETTRTSYSRGYAMRHHQNQNYTRRSVHSSVESSLVGSVPMPSLPLDQSSSSLRNPRALPSNFPSTSSTASSLWNWPRHIQSITSSGDPFYGSSFSAQPFHPSQQTYVPPLHSHAPQGTVHPHFSSSHHLHQGYPSQTHLPPPPPPPSFPLSHHRHTPSQHHGTVWRPYSDRRQTSTSFSLSNILSPSPNLLPSHGLQTGVLPPVVHQQQARVPSFFVDHLLDDL